MNSIDLAKQIRIESLRMVTRAKASHIGGALSMADILAVLYASTMRYNPLEPQWDCRDRLILSKGHNCTALYAVLSISNFFPIELLNTYGKDHSILMSHISHKVPGVEFSTGSLGHGLPFGVGKAIAAKRREEDWRTFVICSDGELNEGSNWEAVMLAPTQSLDNLTLIIDYNKIQSLARVDEVIPLEPLALKFRSFGWNALEIDGHSHQDLEQALSSTTDVNKQPKVVIAHTIKGKGVSFMEDQVLWHYRNPSEEQLELAIKEILNHEN
jgi:transketolase